MRKDSTRQNTNKVRLYIILLLVLAVIAYGGVYLYKSNLTRKIEIASNEPIKATWDVVPEVLNLAVKSSQYKIGGAYLANPKKLNTIAGNEDRDAYSYRLAIDFLRTLTPEQISIMRKNDKLPYNQLTHNQQIALLQIYHSRGRKNVDLSKYNNTSYVKVYSFSKSKQSYIFQWLVELDKNHLLRFFNMEFSAKKNAIINPKYKSED